jgi:predicted amidophosphoribosyltransferase
MTVYKYQKVRLVCNGKIKCCNYCSDIEFSEGYCKECGRPLWKRANEQCGFILGYMDSTIKKQGKLDIICRNCKTVLTI